MFSIIVRCPGFVTRLQQISIEPLDFPPFSVTQTINKENIEMLTKGPLQNR